jgi:histone-arginine methyltransferase CARM1
MSVSRSRTAPTPAEKDGSSEAKSDGAKAVVPVDDEHPFFHYYGQLAHQQNMLQDSVRTGTYRKAVMDNAVDFQGKVVMDVGTGSGILAMFAARAGARKVYAVEASDMAHCARKLIAHNGLSDIITVLHGKVEEIEVKEKVDVIISEPMGFLLVHERMLESFVAARKLFMKPEGRMFPAVGTMFFLPFRFVCC